MILQPLVENSIKHGSREDGRGIDRDPQPSRKRPRRHRGRRRRDGIRDGSLEQPMSSGIGLANVRERLRVIYGATYQLKLTSEPGKGRRAASRFRS
jgi:sensor histidine kinase YesM